MIFIKKPYYLKKNIIPLFICLIGLALRLYKLGGRSLWLDEFWSMHRVNRPFVGTLGELSEFPFPPLYYFMMNIWVKVFGISAAALRFPSVIFSTLTIFLIFKLARELYDEKVGFLSAGLLSVSPYAIHYAQEAKMYSMLWFFGLLSFLFFYRYIKDYNRKDLFGYIISSVICIYTMYVGFIFIIIQNLYLLFLKNDRRVKSWLLGQLVIFLLYIPWLSHCLHHYAQGKKYLTWIPKRGFLESFLYFINILRITAGTTIGKATLLDLLIYCFLGALVFISFKRNKIIFDFNSENNFLIAWVVLPMFIFFTIGRIAFPMLTQRYVGFIHIPLIILFSRGFYKNNFKAVLKFVLMFVLFFTIFSSHLYPYYKYGEGVNGCHNWNGTFRRIHKIADKDALILSIDVKDFIIRYYDTTHEIIEFKEGLDKDLYNKFNSIFIVYDETFCSREKALSIAKELFRYDIREDFFGSPSGFLYLRKRI